MAWSISDLFPPWGDTGEKPGDNFDYQGGDQVNEKHLDYLWDSVGTLEDETRSALEDIDSDSDGVVDRADQLSASFVGSGLNGGDGTSISLNESYAATWTSQHQFSAGLDTRGDIVDDTTTIWDSAGGHIEQSALENAAVTVAGNSVALGGSTGISHGDLSGIGENDHHVKTPNSYAQNDNLSDISRHSAGPIQDTDPVTDLLNISSAVVLDHAVFDGNTGTESVIVTVDGTSTTYSDWENKANDGNWHFMILGGIEADSSLRIQLDGGSDTAGRLSGFAVTKP